MKRLATAAAAAILFTVPAHAGVFGNWASEKNERGEWITVSIYPCEGKVCGKITKIHASDQTDAGKVMITGMNDKGGGRFGGGKIYAPDSRKWYNSKMHLTGGRLKVSGCALGGMVCRSQTWTRQGPN